MWARIVEIMLGCWLIVSPFIFRHDAAQTSLWVNDMLCGFIAVLLGFFSFWNRTAWAHFLLLPLALWLIVFAYLAGHPAPAYAQNQIVVGLLLAMFAIIPNDADLIPPDWRRFYEKEDKI